METARGNGEDVESCDVVPMSSSLDDDSHKSTVAGHEQNVDGLFDSADNADHDCEPVHRSNRQSVNKNSNLDDRLELSHDDDARSHEDDGWIYVLGHGQLKKRTLKPGQVNTRPTRGQLVTVRCSGQLNDGTKVDEHDNLELCIGDDDFITAFDLCLPLMDVGEICQIVTDSRFAHGSVGRQPDVPADAQITYELELCAVTDRPPFHTMTVHQRIKLSNEKRERGNTLYARAQFSRAVDVYTIAEKIVNDDVDSSQELHKLIDSRVKCCNNLAAAQMKIDAWDAALRSCDLVLRVEPDNVKALFRKAKCLVNRGSYDEAVSVLQSALSVEPNSRVIQLELLNTQRKCREQNVSERHLFEKMLGADKQHLAAAAVHKAATASTSHEWRWLWYVAGAVAAVIIPVSVTAYHYVCL